jgi:hypothetical protein
MTILDPLTGLLVKIQNPVTSDSSGRQGWETTNTGEFFLGGAPCRPMTP